MNQKISAITSLWFQRYGSAVDVVLCMEREELIIGQMFLCVQLHETLVEHICFTSYNGLFYAIMFANHSLQNLSNGIIGDLMIGLALEEELFNLQGVKIIDVHLHGIGRKDDHVCDLAGFQRASFLFIKGSPVGVVGHGLQGLEDRQRFCAVVAGLVEPGDWIGIGAGAVGTQTQNDAVVGTGFKRIQTISSASQDGFQIVIGLVGPVDEGTLNSQGNAILSADFQTLGGRQTGVDDGMAMIGGREVIQSGLDGPGGLIECGVADGMKLDLHTGTIGLLAEFGNFLIGIVEDAVIIGALIGFLQSSMVKFIPASSKSSIRGH